MHENRETSGVPRMKVDRDRPEEVQSRNAGMHASEESDHAILPMNQPNIEARVLHPYPSVRFAATHSRWEPYA
jgi:hypothetical protein